MSAGTVGPRFLSANRYGPTLSSQINTNQHRTSSGGALGWLDAALLGEGQPHPIPSISAAASHMRGPVQSTADDGSAGGRADREELAAAAAARAALTAKGWAWAGGPGG